MATQNYAVGSTQDRIFELWMPRAKATSLEVTDSDATNKFNYWNKVPIQQGSIIIIQDESKVLTYIITENMGSLSEQKGYWKEL